MKNNFYSASHIFFIIFLSAQLKTCYSSHYIELNRQFSTFQKKSQFFYKQPVVANLNIYLTPFGDCLVNLINYQYVNILAPEIPLLLTRYDVVKVEYKKHNERRLKPQKTFQLNIFKFENYNKTKFQHCDDETCDDDYTQAAQKSYLINQKQWFCEVQVYLFPPQPPNPLFYDYDPSLQKYFFILPKMFQKYLFLSDDVPENPFTKPRLIVMRTKFDILINFQRPALFQVAPIINTLYTFRYGTAHGITMVRQEFLLFPIELLGSCAKPGQGRTSTEIFTSIKSIWAICQHCQRCISLTSFRKFDSNSLTKEALLTFLTSLSSDPDKIFYSVWFNAGFFYPFQFPLNTEYSKIRDFTSSNISPTHSLEHFRYIIDSQFIKLLLGNATLRTPNPTGIIENHNYDCVDNSFDPYVFISFAGKLDYIHVRFHVSELKFVSCGVPLVQHLPFEQLINIFDGAIWVFTLVTTIAVSALCSIMLYIQSDVVKLIPWKSKLRRKRLLLRIWKRSKISDFLNSFAIPSFMTSLRILLDQGEGNDPMTLQIMRNKPLRFVIGSYLLAAVVISNAYRHENITQLTLPRLPIPFDNFDILVENKFDIYTRGYYLGGVSTFRDFLESQVTRVMLMLVEPRPPYDPHSISVIFSSELYSFIKDEGLFWTFCLPKEQIKHRFLYYMNHTKLHKEWFKILLSRSITNKEILGRCNNTALFLPALEAHELYHNMRKTSTSNVFLGQNLGLKNSHGIAFLRSIHPKLLRRLGSLMQSGIWDWWDRFILDFMTKVSAGMVGNGNSFKASTMNGNIQLVFLVCVGCILVSLPVFVVELLLKVNLKGSIKKAFDKRKLQQWGPAVAQQCPPEGVSFLPLPDCTLYLICDNGLGTVMECAAGLYFNPSTEQCDYYENVPECVGGTRPPGGSTIPPTTTTNTNATEIPSTEIPSSSSPATTTTTEEPEPEILTQCGQTSKSPRGQIKYKLNETYARNELCSFIINIENYSGILFSLNFHKINESDRNAINIFTFNENGLLETAHLGPPNPLKQVYLSGSVAVIIFRTTTVTGKGFQLSFEGFGATTFVKGDQQIFSILRDESGQLQIPVQGAEEGRDTINAYVVTHNHAVVDPSYYSMSLKISNARLYVCGDVMECACDSIRVYTFSNAMLSQQELFCDERYHRTSYVTGGLYVLLVNIHGEQYATRNATLSWQSDGL
ncbi:unnamed protein product [Orchesella dallaii]|uniref:Chitin-binding type-2 domain-containing protein n=1 Tax=Orchesella dallaii TaxID=48710 RepID=A0ABP1RAG6_9HEXA